MPYYLRQDKKKKGPYLQMYESYWDKEKNSLVQEISKALDMSPISFPMRFQTRFLITRNMWRKRTENTQILLLIKRAPGHSLPSLKKTSDTFLLPPFFRS